LVRRAIVRAPLVEASLVRTPTVRLALVEVARPEASAIAAGAAVAASRSSHAVTVAAAAHRLPTRITSPPPADAAQGTAAPPAAPPASESPSAGAVAAQCPVVAFAPTGIRKTVVILVTEATSSIELVEAIAHVSPPSFPSFRPTQLPTQRVGRGCEIS